MKRYFMQLRNPDTPLVEKKLHEFIKENPDHQFSDKLIKSYYKKLDKIVRSSEHLKNKDESSNASFKDTLTSVTCLKNTWVRNRSRDSSNLS